MGVHLFLQYYIPEDPIRRREIDTCLHQNILNRNIDRVHVFLERKEDLKYVPAAGKVSTQHLPGRITYADWLSATNELPEGEVSICVNADMYLDDSIFLLRKHAHRLAARKHFLALTRYNHDGEKFVLNSNPHWTQDTWAVIRGGSAFHRGLLQEARFELGHPGCDNKIAYVMHSYGFTVSNPCLQVRTIHLHSKQERPYDSRGDKLIGLHAFVHPSSKLGEPSRLEVELLSRAPTDLTEISVNQWINQRKHYKLSGDSPNEVNRPTVVSVVASEQLAKAVFLGKMPELVHTGDSPDREVPPEANRPKKKRPSPVTSTESGMALPPLPFSYERREDVDVSEMRLHRVFGHRFEIYEGKEEWVFLDASWPSVARLPKSVLNSDFELLADEEQFAMGFAYPVLDLFPTVIAPSPRSKLDVLFWQFPCRTEQDAWQQSNRQPRYRKTPGERDIYVGLPWATFIDKERDPEVLLMLMASRLREVREVLEGFGVTLRIHTVCQHIFWRRQISNFRRLGITDLWISHKSKGHDQEAGVRLHAWSLYAVNYRDPERQKGLEIKPVAERRVLASFKGAHMPHYLSGVRLELKKLAGRPRFDVELSDEWHFNKVVYELQVAGNALPAEHLNQNTVKEYNQKLSNSVFSLCPVGAGPNTLRLWESLAVGAIPVVLSDTHELPDVELFGPGCALTWEDAVVFHPEADVATLEKRLRAIPLGALQKMQSAGRLLYQMMAKFSPVGVPHNDGGPLELIDLFKPQQCHIDKMATAVVDGKARWVFARVDLKKGRSGNLYFDKTERLIGIHVALQSAQPIRPVKVNLFSARLPPRQPQLLKTIILDDNRFQMLWFDAAETSIWAYGLRWEIEADGTAEGAAGYMLLTPLVEKDGFAKEITALDASGILKAASDANSARKDDLFDTEWIATGEILERIRKIRTPKGRASLEKLFPSVKPRRTNLIGERIGRGITMFIHLMNRNENVVTNLANWLGQKVDELILLDWSSRIPVSSIHGVLEDPRVRIVRVDAQRTFIRSWAQNIATRMARHEKIFKCDSDVVFIGDFFSNHPLKRGEFWVGDWMQGRDFNERHLHGDTYYHIDDFEKVNGYDERIGTYGHDDTNLKDRMVLAGLRKRVFSYDQIYHQPHENKKRITNQDMVHPMVNTRYHRIVTNQIPLWGPQLPRATEQAIVGNSDRIITLKIKTKFADRKDTESMDQAIDLVASWYAGALEINKMSREEKIQLIWEKSLE